MIKMQKKNLAILLSIITVAIVIIATILAYLSYTTTQHNQQLAQITKQNQRVQNFLQQYANAQFRITEEPLTKDSTVYQCWIVTWYNPDGDFFDHTVVVWIDKDSLEIVEVQEIW